jgi:signal transduction histidine kinase
MNRRILIVDDTEAIHHDFREILGDSREDSAAMSDAKAALLGERVVSAPRMSFDVESAFHGQEAIDLIQTAIDEGQPFAMAFVDVRMPPGFDGIETLERIWRVDPTLQAVICTAFSDYSWEEMLERFGLLDRLLILRKPFDNMEVRQLAAALTRKWHLERESRVNMDQLTKLVEDRTRAIARARDDLLVLNQKLEGARLAAEEANTAKTSFLANISHEIRTPMTAILGFADYLFEEGDIKLAPQERVQAIETIRRNGDHLVQLINDLLDISKIEADKLDIEQIKCSPAEVASEVVFLMQGRARHKGLELTSEVIGEIPETINSDPTRLRQILVNLVGNAIKFTEQGHVKLQMRLLRTDEGEPMFRYDVVDTGIGLTRQQQQRLFRPFAQADESTTRKFGGTGLGLSICQRLAGMLGGSVEVESEVGQGSTFRVILAAGSLDGVRMMNQQQLLSFAENAESPSQKSIELDGRILLAEDGVDNQRLFSHILLKAGAEVIVVENGALACDEYKAASDSGEPFDLILMDMQMPVLDGYDATRRLRQIGCEAPIIAMTAHAMNGDREACLDAGCSDYLTKPIRRTNFLELVARYTGEAALHG